MSLTGSPLDSENGGTPRVRKKKTNVYKVYDDLNIEYNLDDINLGLLNQTRKTGFVPPEGIFSKREHRDTVNSRFNDGFFTNAKAASMLERGWRQAELNGEPKLDDFRKGETGLLTIDDGPELEVEVIEGFHRIHVPVTPTTGWTVYGYTFKELGKEESQTLELLEKHRHSKWNFYIRTRPVPFTPLAPSRKRGGSRQRNVKKGRKTRKMRRKA